MSFTKTNRNCQSTNNFQRHLCSRNDAEGHLQSLPSLSEALLFPGALHIPWVRTACVCSSFHLTASVLIIGPIPLFIFWAIDLATCPFPLNLSSKHSLMFWGNKKIDQVWIIHTDAPCCTFSCIHLTLSKCEWEGVIWYDDGKICWNQSMSSRKCCTKKFYTLWNVAVGAMEGIWAVGCNIPIVLKENIQKIKII